MKKAAVLIAVFLTGLAVPVFVSADYGEEKTVYVDIVRNTPDLELPHKVFLLEWFIKKFPDSPFRGQAELRIAEYLQIHYSFKAVELKFEEEALIEKAAGDEKEIERVRNYYERQRRVAVEERKVFAPIVYRLLTKIIVNRGRERVYHSLSDEWSNEEYLAAWAFYYRGLWFAKGEDLRLLLKKYPKCGEPCRLAERALKAKKTAEPKDAE
ncbi:MAG: hypothetical protein HZA37_02690 [Parcubacteria group bacterium]|nr:hypothetical protein [Parcubacteria group bacterium]